MKELVTRLQGKAVREFATRMVTGAWKIERESLNRYRVYAGTGEDYTLVDRRSFVLLDKEIYRIQSRQNPIAFAIEKALDNDALEFCIDKASVDKMPVKLLARTFSISKVVIENVSLKLDNYIIKFSLIQSVSERDLTQKEMELANLFKRANDAAGNPETEKPALTAPETAAAVDNTAKEIPAK